MAELIVIEQFTQILLVGAREWVKHHWPSMLSEGMTLMGNYMDAEEMIPRALRPGNAGSKAPILSGGQARKECWGPLVCPTLGEMPLGRGRNLSPNTSERGVREPCEEEYMVP